nr:lantibiotic dehydratase [uncultured Dyadobacter sp.]
MIRRPLLAENLLASVNRALRADPSSLEKQIIRVMNIPLFQEALYLASPDLYRHGIDLSEGRPVTGKHQVLISIYKYLIRACTRSTPFGLFAGYCQASLAELTQIEFSGRFKKHTTLSGQVLTQIGSISAQERNESLSQPLSINSSLYKGAGGYRYAIRDRSQPDAQALAFREIEDDPDLKTVLDCCKPSASWQTIQQTLTSSGVSQQGALDLIQALIKEQVLVCGKEQPLSLQAFQSQLLSHAGGSFRPVFESYDRVRQTKADGAQRFAPLEKALKDTGITATAPVQIDLQLRTRHCSLRSTEINRIIKEVGKLLVGRPPHDEQLSDFIKKFTARFETRQIPLMQALDPDTGVGFGQTFSLSPEAEIASGLTVKAHGPKSPVSTAPAWIQDAYAHGQLHPGKAYMVSEAELNLAGASSQGTQAEGFSILGSIITNSAAGFDSGNYLFELKGIAGPGSAQLMARFADADDDLRQVLRKMVEREQAEHPSVIFAEITYSPSGLQGSVTRRPQLNDYQLCYLTSGESTSIPLEDIMLAVKGSQIVLYSQKLKARILPRLNSAHNFTQGPALYRFLCSVACQQAPQMFWDGASTSHYPFFPRVQYGRVIISKARWNVSSCWLPEAAKADQANLNWWKKARKLLGIPRFVSLGENDAQLLIDGDCPVAVAILADALRKKKLLSLTEVPGSPGRGLLSTKNKGYRNEVVIPVLSGPQFPQEQDHPRTTDQTKRFMGSEDGWLFVKIYGSENFLHQLLTSKLIPFVIKLQMKGLLQKWFFIRYKDPDTHIRLRIYSPGMQAFEPKITNSLNALLEAELASGAVHRLQSQLYERETARYQLMDYAQVETLFFIDSQAVAGLLRSQPLGLAPELRWLTAMLAADQTLDAFGHSLDSKFRFVSLVCQDTGSLRVDHLYRQHKSVLIKLMQHPEQHLPLADTFLALSDRKALIQTQLSVLEGFNTNKSIPFIADLIHLFCNRYFCSYQKTHESIIYHFLKKYYDFQLNVEKVVITDFASNQM